MSVKPMYVTDPETSEIPSEYSYSYEPSFYDEDLVTQEDRERVSGWGGIDGWRLAEYALLETLGLRKRD